MKKLIIAATSALALAACAEAEAPVEEEEVVEEVAAATAAGTYDYASADGAITGTIVMNEDGTFVDNEEGAEEQTGAWSSADGKTCFTDSAEGAEEVCFTDGEIGEDGSWQSTGPDGTVFTVSPAAAEESAEEAA